jgi:hypothetical protein
MIDDDFLVLVNAWWQPLGFTIPATRDGLTWQRIPKRRARAGRIVACAAAADSTQSPAGTGLLDSTICSYSPTQG